MKATVEALRLAQEQARELDGKIRKAEKTLNQSVGELERLIREYDQTRRKLFATECSKRKVCWCKCCFKIVPVSSMAYIFIHEVKREFSGYQNSCYGFNSYKHLHLACEACRANMKKRHGWVGETSTSLKEQESYHAFDVELRDGDFYVCRFGSWEKLEKPSDFSPPQFPDEVSGELSKKWGLPPRLNIIQQRLIDPDWIVDGKPA